MNTGNTVDIRNTASQDFANCCVSHPFPFAEQGMNHTVCQFTVAIAMIITTLSTVFLPALRVLSNF